MTRLAFNQLAHAGRVVGTAGVVWSESCRHLTQDEIGLGLPISHGTDKAVPISSQFPANLPTHLFVYQLAPACQMTLLIISQANQKTVPFK